MVAPGLSGGLVGGTGAELLSLQVFWSSTPFRVSTGRGGAVAAAGSNRVTIRDSVFHANEAPQGATLRISSTLSARITNTGIGEPADEWSSAVSAFGASIATCFDNPCSTFCEACGPNEIGMDGIACVACDPGSQPNNEQTECQPGAELSFLGKPSQPRHPQLRWR